MKKILGGNCIETRSKIHLGKTTLHNNHFNLFLIKLKKNQSYRINDNNLILLNLSNNSNKLYINNHRFNENNYLISINNKILVKSLSNDSTLLVAGSKKKSKKKYLEVNKISNAKKVTKPWGSEIWFLNKNINIAFKKICINKGYKTSLQYHRFKKEVNFLYNGNMNLFYKKKNIPNKLIKNYNLNSIKLKKFSSVYVKPYVVHRIHALNKIVLYEASTNQLNDVIRIQDDTSRPNGLISNEHKKK